MLYRYYLFYISECGIEFLYNIFEIIEDGIFRIKTGIWGILGRKCRFGLGSKFLGYYIVGFYV
jgi:hypothetical protein